MTTANHAVLENDYCSHWNLAFIESNLCFLKGDLHELFVLFWAHICEYRHDPVGMANLL